SDFGKKTAMAGTSSQATAVHQAASGVPSRQAIQYSGRQVSVAVSPVSKVTIQIAAISLSRKVPPLARTFCRIAANASWIVAGCVEFRKTLSEGKRSAVFRNKK